MRKIKFIFVFIVLCIISCQSNRENPLSKDSIESKIERIIITKENPCITFIISFKNKTNKDIVLSGNNVNAMEYQDCGITMRNDKFVTPLGGLIPKEGLLILNANQTEKFIFIYSPNYPNKHIELKGSDTQKELGSFLRDCKFYYKNNKKNLDENYQKFVAVEEEPKDKRYPFYHDFEISNVNTPIEYRDSLTVEETFGFIGQKMIEMK